MNSFDYILLQFISGSIVGLIIGHGIAKLLIFIYEKIYEIKEEIKFSAWLKKESLTKEEFYKKIKTPILVPEKLANDVLKKIILNAGKE